MFRTFKLYPEEQHWWSMADYGAVVDAVAEVAAKRAPGASLRALEFGPGWSTRSLIEGGATHVDACEDDPHWAAVHRERLEPAFPGVVRIHDYTWAPTIVVPTLEGAARYDVALIDGPVQTARRVAAVNYAVKVADRVIVAVDAAAGMARRLEQLGKRHRIQLRTTGPLAEQFAIIDIGQGDGQADTSGDDEA